MGWSPTRYVVMAVAVGAFSLAIDFTWKMNYVRTTARVTDILENCSMQKTKRGLIDETRIDTRGGSCRAARTAIETDPAYEGYELIKQTFVEYKYVSPADGRTHRSRHMQATHDDGRAIRSGDDLVILAHKTNPKDTMEY